MEAIGLIYGHDGVLSEVTDNDVLFLRNDMMNRPEVRTTKEELAKEAIDLVAHFEGLHDGNKATPALEPQMDPVGIWTVGFGIALRHPNGVFMKHAKDKAAAYAHPKAFLTEAAYWDLLKEMMTKDYLPLVKKMVGNFEMNAFTKGALTSFAYNCGTHYKNSKGRLIPFAIWNNVKVMTPPTFQSYWEKSVIMAGGKVYPGLVRRRKAEAYLYRFKKLKLVF